MNGDSCDSSSYSSSWSGESWGQGKPSCPCNIRTTRTPKFPNPVEEFVVGVEDGPLEDHWWRDQSGGKGQRKGSGWDGWRNNDFDCLVAIFSLKNLTRKIFKFISWGREKLVFSLLTTERCWFDDKTSGARNKHEKSETNQLWVTLPVLQSSCFPFPASLHFNSPLPPPSDRSSLQSVMIWWWNDSVQWIPSDSQEKIG